MPVNPMVMAFYFVEPFTEICVVNIWSSTQRRHIGRILMILSVLPFLYITTWVNTSFKRCLLQNM